MAEITTRELLTRYYQSLNDDYKARAAEINIDKPELFTYEEQIGKELLDMNVDELIGLIRILVKGRSYSTQQIMSVMRDLFNYYIDIAEVKIKNPFSDKRMIRRNVAREIVKEREPIRFAKIEETLNEIRVKEPQYADYIELILRLWYDGLFKADEIVNLKEKDINPKTLMVSLPGRTARLSFRTYSLLRKFEELDEIEGARKYELKTWHGGCFKFIFNQKTIDHADDTPFREMCQKIYYIIKVHVDYKYDTEFTYRNVYWLGFFDYLCRKYGEKKTTEMIISYRNTDDIRTLEYEAKEYGTVYSDAANIRKYLMELVRI